MIGVVALIYLVLYIRHLVNALKKETKHIGKGLMHLQSKFPVDLKAMREEELIREMKGGNVDAEFMLVMKFGYNERDLQKAKGR